MIMDFIKKIFVGMMIVLMFIVVFINIFCLDIV